MRKQSRVVIPPARLLEAELKMNFWGPQGFKVSSKRGRNKLELRFFNSVFVFWRWGGDSYSGQVRPRQGTEICNFGAPSPLEALHLIFCFFSSIYVQFSKTSPPKPGESSEKSSGENRVKSCHVCGCHGFFGPDLCQLHCEPELGTPKGRVF